MIIYPNQKVATIHKAPANSENYYGIMNKKAAQRAARELTQNEMRVYLCLTLNQPDFQMAVSTAYIAQNYGGSVDGLQTAVKGLINKGYLVKEKGNYYNFYDDPQMANQASESSIRDNTQYELGVSMVKNLENSCDKPGEISVEIIHRDYIENIKDYNGKFDESFSDEWDLVFERIQVKRYPHTMKKLAEVVGYSPDVFVIKRLVDEHWQAFERKFTEQGGYRFQTLLNLASQEYEKWKKVISSEKAMQEKRICVWPEEYPVDYNATRIPRKKRIGLDELEDDAFQDASNQEGRAYVSDILDEIFNEYSDAC